MLTLRRYVVVLLAILAATSLAPAPATAGDGAGGTTCANPSAPECDVNAGTPGKPGNDTGGQNGGSSGNQGGGDSGTQCTYEAAFPSAEMIAALGGQPTGEGGWYFKSCYQDNGMGVSFPGPIWIAGAPPVVSPAVLAQQARSRLRLPSVAIRLNPSGDQLVNLPTWLALDQGSWQSQSATASVPGVSVTATARPVKAVWSLGEGGSVTCTGPGTPWKAGTDPMASSPDCGYTYRRSSAGSAGAAFSVTVTITWEVTWAGAGQSGTIAGLSTTGTVPVRVAESQAVITS
ncbi:MAG: hypothetical protein JXA67_17075 [Micromonosporaceae bacterium]|nr:hypothetical protein [Micromonosporaceae bacterium]